MQNEAEAGNATRKSQKQRLTKKKIKTSRRLVGNTVANPPKSTEKTSPATSSTATPLNLATFSQTSGYSSLQQELGGIYIPDVSSYSGSQAPCPSASCSPSPPLTSALGLPQYMPDVLSLSDESDEVSDVESFFDNADIDEVNAAFCAVSVPGGAGGISPPPGSTGSFLLSSVAEGLVDAAELRSVDVETQARLEALLEAAGIGKISATDGKTLADPEVLRCLTSSVSSALDEAAAALTRMRADNSQSSVPHATTCATTATTCSVAPTSDRNNQPNWTTSNAPLSLPTSDCTTSESSANLNRVTDTTSRETPANAVTAGASGTVGAITSSGAGNGSDSSVSSSASSSSSTSGSESRKGRGVSGSIVPTLAEACSDGDVITVRRLLDEGHSVHETSEEGESLLSLACSAGYFKLAQILLAMRANVEDRGIKGDCTPLMEAASGGYNDIVKLLMEHGADLNAQSSSGNTPLHYACCGGYEDVVVTLLDAGASIEETNENGHTPLMEAASAGHVGVAKILLDRGAGINTHSNEFKESALTLACYKGHLEMVKFLLEAGADQEHKTDEMHTALMEASMDGHVEVAKLLLDHGAEVNMPADSFESPLTLAACGGHVELAMLLIERGANLEEVNDEGYTPLMEASREGHEEMVALLLSQGADINAQTEETQETALTLACCGGFLEVADFLVKAGADLELGCSTPLMEASQEGHLELVQYLIKAVANVNAQTGTGDTALSYACENGHTDVADVLLGARADLEHQAEGGRSPLMKAARAGHLCTVQFLLNKGANVNHMTSNNDHSVLSLACAGGHLQVVELLLQHGADPSHRLKDGSTMLIEAAKGGHTGVVQLLLDYPNSVFTASDLPQLTMSPVPVVGTNGSLSVGSGVMQPNVNNVGQAMPIDPSQDPLCSSVGMDENIGIPKVPNATSKGNHPGVADGGPHHHHHPLHYHHHAHGTCTPTAVGGGNGSSSGSICKGGHHHHHQQWSGGMEAGDGAHHHHSTSSTSSAKSFTKKRGEGKTSERRDSKSSSSSSQNANNALPLPSRSNPQQGQQGAGSGSTHSVGPRTPNPSASLPFSNTYTNAMDIDFSKFTSDWPSKGMMMGDGSMGDGPSLVEVAKLAKEALRSGAMAAGVSIGESESILEQMAAAAVATGAISGRDPATGKIRPSTVKDGIKKKVVSTDEQIQRKQQILQELQKVEQELKEKAQQQNLPTSQPTTDGVGANVATQSGKINSPSLQSLQIALKEACGELRQHQLSPSTPHLPAPPFPFGFVDADPKDSTPSPGGVTGVTDTGVERRIELPGGVEYQEVQETMNQPHPPHPHHHHQQQNIILPQLQLSSEQQQQLQMQLLHMSTLQNMMPSSMAPVSSTYQSTLQPTTGDSATAVNPANTFATQPSSAGNHQVYQLQYQQQTIDVDPSSAAAVAVVAAQHLHQLQFQQQPAALPVDYQQLRLQAQPSVVINNYNNNNSAAATDAGYIVTSSATNYAPQWSSDVSPSLPPRPTRQPAPSPSSEGDDDDDDDDDDCPDPSQFQEESIVGDIARSLGPSGVAPMDLRPEAEASNLASGEDDFDAYEEDGEDEDDEDDDDDDDDESTEEESPDDEGGLETDDGDVEDSDDQEESEDEGLSTAITSPTDASMLEMATNTNDTNAICEDSNTEASETPSFPTEEPAAGKTASVVVMESNANVIACPSSTAPFVVSASSSSALSSLSLPNQASLHGGEVACSTCQHPLSLFATPSNLPVVNSAAGNLVASTYSTPTMHYAQHPRLSVPYQMTSEQFSASLSGGGDAVADVNQIVASLEPNPASSSPGVVTLTTDPNAAGYASSLQQQHQLQQSLPTHQAQIPALNVGHVPTPSPSSSLTFSQSNCSHGISFATTLAPGTLVVPASNGQLFSLAPTTLDPNNPAVAGQLSVPGGTGQLTPEGCSQLLQAAAAAAAATTDPLQQQAILQQFAAQGVAIAQVGLLQPQYNTQQHGMQVQQENSMMGTTVTTSAAAAMHLATVQQIQQYQQQQQVTVLGQGVAAGHQQQTIQIPPILTQLDLLQKQLLLQQQAQQQLGVGPNGVNVGTGIPQMGAVVSQSCMSTQLHQQQVAIPAQVDTLSPMYPPVDLNAQTESNHDTALTLACAGGHEELVRVLLQRGANLEHRDKKGFTPLILAATAGHSGVVEILLDHGAEIEAQSERTKDTPLSLACSGGRYEVVDILLQRGAMKEHRNVSDYTPLSLAASGGYVTIIKLLLTHGAEINSRTGSKLGISPLMLAAMNGHTNAVKLLLDMGSDINAQIETNRNTALTLACFQGRHEVVSLLVDRKANIEHRAKTGLTPLMEAASGGYYEVGKVLLNKGADVNAPPVPSSRDTALTIAADKGQIRFVELLILRGAALDVKNKKGNSPLWLAANGGHLEVVQQLVGAGADVDSQDNRKMSCLMASFRKGHTKVVKYLVKHVKQFPSDLECMRYIQTVNDKDMLKKCHNCMDIIVSAKDRQAAEANKNATNLLKELDLEKNQEEHRKIAAAKKREKKKQKRKQKKQQEKTEEREDGGDGASEREDDDQDDMDDRDEDDCIEEIGMGHADVVNGLLANKKAVMNRLGTDLPANGGGNNNTVSDFDEKRFLQKLISGEKAVEALMAENNNTFGKRTSGDGAEKRVVEKEELKKEKVNNNNNNVVKVENAKNSKNKKAEKKADRKTEEINQKKKMEMLTPGSGGDADRIVSSVVGKVSSAAELKEKIESGFAVQTSKKKNKEKDAATKGIIGFTNSPKKGDKKNKSGTEEAGWKEVVRRSKKLAVPSNVVSRVIGRGGCNINAIREVSGAHIEVEKQKGTALERTILIKGSTEATRQAQFYINALVKEPDRDLMDILPKNKQKYLTNAINAAANKAAVAAVASEPGVTPSSTPIPFSATGVVASQKGTSAITTMANSASVTITTAANKKKGSVTSTEVTASASGVLTSQFSSSGISPGTLFAQAVKKPAGGAVVTTNSSVPSTKSSGSNANQAQQQQQQQQQQQPLINSTSSPAKSKNGNSPAHFPSTSKSSPTVSTPSKASATAARQLFPASGAVDVAKTKAGAPSPKSASASAKNRGGNGSSHSANGSSKEKNKGSRSKNNSGSSQNKANSPMSLVGTPVANPSQASFVAGQQQQLHQPVLLLQQQQQQQQPSQQQNKAPAVMQKLNVNSQMGSSSQSRGFGNENLNPAPESHATQQMMVPPLMQPTAEYSPFNNLFSNMAEQVLHSGHNPVKDEYDQDSPGSSSSRMNFASAVGLSSNAPGSPNDVGDQGHHLSQKVDASKAPGYKMNLNLNLETNVTKAPGYRPPPSVSTSLKPQLSPHEAAVQKMASQLASLSPGSNHGQDHNPLSPQGATTAPAGMTPSSPGRAAGLGPQGHPSGQMRSVGPVGPGSPSQSGPPTSQHGPGRMNQANSNHAASDLQDPIERLMQSLQINNLSIPLVTQGNLVSTIATSYNSSSFSSSFMTTLSSDSINNAQHLPQMSSSRAPGPPNNPGSTGPPAPIGSHLRNRGIQNMSPSQNDLGQMNAFGPNMFDHGSSNNSFNSQDPFSLLPPHLQQSMTLPVIQSNLNPYAPDFTSRHLGTSVTATHGTASSIGSMGPMPNLPFPSNLVPPSSLQPSIGVSNPPRIAGLMDSVNASKATNSSNQPSVSLFGLAFQDNKNPSMIHSNPPNTQQPPLPPSTNVVTHLPPPPPPLVMPPSSRHPPPSHMMPATIAESSHTMGGIPNLMNVQPLQGMPAPDLPGGNNPASALFNMNLLTPGSSNFGMMPPPPPNAPQNSSYLNNPTAALDAMLRPGLTPTKKDQAALSKFAATIGMIPPPGSSGTGSPHNTVHDKVTKRPDNSIFGTDFSFMDGMARNDDTSRMWSHKSGDGFGSKTPNFSDPTGPSLGSIGSHPPGTNDSKLDNAFASQMNFGPTGFFGNSSSNSGNAPALSNFGSGLNAPFGNVGGIGGNGNSSGDATTPLPPFPMLWGNSGLGLKNMGGTPGLGGFQTNSETIQSTAGDLPDSNASNWNGNAPRS